MSLITDNGSAFRRLSAVSLLGFASGLPLALTDSTLQAWLTMNDISVTAIGLFSLLTLPYVLKFIWAPLLDRYSLGVLGRRRGWILVAQALLAGTILSLAGLSPSEYLQSIALLTALLAFLSATQDIAIDAYRAEVLRPSERGLGASLSVTTYKLATVVSGAGAFFLAEQVGFNRTYAALAVVMASMILFTIVAPAPASNAPGPRNLYEAVIAPFRQFFERDGALALLILICLYKLGDAATAKLSITFFIRELTFSLSDVGAIYKGLGVAASLLGGLIGGIVMLRVSLFNALLWFAVVGAVTNLGFCLLAIIGKSYAAMVVVVVLENLSGGLGTTALVALLMALCNARYTATQFALLTAVASLGRVFSGPPAGMIVEHSGWVVFFFSTVLVLIPVLMLLIRLRTHIGALDIRRAST